MNKRTHSLAHNHVTKTTTATICKNWTRFLFWCTDIETLKTLFWLLSCLYMCCVCVCVRACVSVCECRHIHDNSPHQIFWEIHEIRCCTFRTTGADFVVHIVYTRSKQPAKIAQVNTDDMGHTRIHTDTDEWRLEMLFILLPTSSTCTLSQRCRRRHPLSHPSLLFIL